MGRRATEWWFYKYPTSLDSPLQAIMSRAVAHCLDDEALLRKSRAWLAEKAGTSTRSLERHEPTLKDLGLLVRGDDGYRLPLFFDFDRQNGGAARQNVRQNGEPLTLPYLEGLKPGKEIHAREAENENTGNQEFTYALCSICETQHRFSVDETYFDTYPRLMACPLVLAKLKAGVT